MTIETKTAAMCINTKKAAKASAEPLEEGIRSERRPRGLLAGMTDEELAGYTEWVMDSIGIDRRVGLEGVDPGLYRALLRHEKENPGMLRKAGLEEKRRDWDGMDDDQIIAHAQQFMKEMGMTGKLELKRADNGLYHVLRKREKKMPGVMEKVGFEMKQMDWSSMDDDQIVVHTRQFMKEMGIRYRSELKSAKVGLYQALRRRERTNPGIVERAFSEADSLELADAVNGVLDALDSFGDEK